MRIALSLFSASIALLISCRQADNDAPNMVDPQSDQETPFIFGAVHRMHSKVLDQDRVLNVHLPDGFSKDSAATYPVIYVLDGSANEDFPHIAGLVQFMNMYDLLAKSIVVGIANVDRAHDFTHATKGDSDLVWLPTAGGSAAFIEFLGKEMQPFVEAHYPTSSHRTIIGQSLGGLLTTEVLFKEPGLFDDYIIVSPSLWWDNGSLASAADAWTIAHGTLPKRVFLAMGKDDDWSQAQVDTVLAAFKAHARPPFKWEYAFFPEETHATILHRAAYRGFEFMHAE